MHLSIGFKYLIYNINSISVPVLFSGLMTFEQAIDLIREREVFKQVTDTKVVATLRSAGYLYCDPKRTLHRVIDSDVTDTVQYLPKILATGWAPSLNLVSRDVDSSILSTMLDQPCTYYLISEECMILPDPYDLKGVSEDDWGVVRYNAEAKRFDFITSCIRSNRVKTLTNQHEIAFNMRGR